MPKLTGIDAEIAYQLITQKEKVKYYSKIVSLLFASIPILVEIFKQKESPKPNQLLLQQTAKRVIDWTVWIPMLIIAVITYFTAYYTVSSLFWPESLSIVNCLVLVPCVVYTGFSVWKRGKLLFRKK
jgi:hypothetical protein